MAVAPKKKIGTDGKVKVRGFEAVAGSVDTVLPVRGTRTSAGYDFIATEDLFIQPQQVVKFKTNVKAYMNAGEVLMLFIRSSLGVKQDIMIANTVGVVDSDYYGNVDNDGNCILALRNLKPELSVDKVIKVVDTKGEQYSVPVITDLREENLVVIKKGERVAQGIFMPFLESDNCNTDVKRVGGEGSTGKK